MGNPDFAVPSLERILGSRHQVKAVVTGSDKRRARSRRKSKARDEKQQKGGERREVSQPSDGYEASGRPQSYGTDEVDWNSFSPVKKVAIQADVPVIQTDDVTCPVFFDKIKVCKPDLLVVVAFKILPASILSIPRLGAINLHASLLPKYRGAAPIHHALLNGEKETGCTVFLLDDKVDTGAVLNQVKVPVGPLETTGDLYDKLKISGAELIIKSIDQLASGTHTQTPQQDRQATSAPKITTEDARIDFNRDYLSTDRLIRAMSPFPGAWTSYQGKKIKIIRSGPAPQVSLSPGKAAVIDNVAYVGCKNGSVILLEVQPESKKKVSGVDFLNGFGGSVVFEE